MPLDEIVEQINFSPVFPDDKQMQNIYNFSLRPETKDDRSSIYFYVKLQNGIIRVKQFFYDWALPFIFIQYKTSPLKVVSKMNADVASF
ncbi:hypothetical protein ACFVT8_14745 [Lysinibacillus sp. NPDC058147]|uniref:hypothetical protein n=1 Tax=unclassified Lysinibacillus TaxID=2636778 RepID=UPI0036D85BB2